MPITRSTRSGRLRATWKPTTDPQSWITSVTLHYIFCEAREIYLCAVRNDFFNKRGNIVAETVELVIFNLILFIRSCLAVASLARSKCLKSVVLKFQHERNPACCCVRKTMEKNDDLFWRRSVRWAEIFHRETCLCFNEAARNGFRKWFRACWEILLLGPACSFESGKQHDGEAKKAAEDDVQNPSYDEENQARENM